MREQELIKLLKEATNTLEEAMRACVNKKERELEQKVWRAASDIEYVTFLLSLRKRSGDESWKKEWKKTDDMDTGPALLAAQDLLKEALEHMASDKEEAYRRTWIARGYVLDVQGKLEKSRSKK